MAPEQIRGTPAVSHKTDLYSLGVLFYQMLTGKTPFDGSSAVVLMHCHLNEPPPRPGDKVQELPREFDDLVVKLMAKAPADRPWDAAIVEQVFKDLDDRAQRGDAIDMVWPSAGSAAANPSRAGVGVTEGRTRKKGRKSSTWGGLSSGFATRDPDGRLVRSRLLSRGTLEVAGLVAALFAIGGFIGYWVWPPSAQYLYRQAEALMASPRRSDRITARDEFLDPLDQRYPDHPYREQTRKWRDEIILEDAEGRAKTLSSPVKIPPLTDPQNNPERQYVSFDVLAAKATSEGNERMAAMYWQEMAKVLKADDPDERPWYLLALKRASELETRIRERRAFVVEKLQRADAALQAGRPNEYLEIRSMLFDKYGRYSDLSDLLGASPGAQPPESGHPNTSPESGPVPASPPATSPAHTAVPDQEPRSTLPPSTKPPDNQ
jgi:serine/threonine-protein kinase